MAETESGKTTKEYYKLLKSNANYNTKDKYAMPKWLCEVMEIYEKTKRLFLLEVCDCAY